MVPGEVPVSHDRGLDRIVDFCKAGVVGTGVDSMAVTLTNAVSGLDLLYATDALAEGVAQLEFALGQGPNVDTVSSRQVSAADDLDNQVSAHRWPLYAGEAVSAGVRGVQSYPIILSSGVIGAVGLYSRRPTRLSNEQHRRASDVTELIGLSLVEPGTSGSIAVGLRMSVHQAAGMVMQQTGTSIQDALVLLRSTAFAEDRLVTDVAADVIAGRRRFEKTGMIDD